MEILTSESIKDFNEFENSSIIVKGANSKKKNAKWILGDIGENLYLILVSLIPLIFYPILYLLIDDKIDVIEQIFSNPDLMLLPIPYILHCMLLISGRGVMRWKKPIIGWYILIIIVSILFYLVLKLEIIKPIFQREIIIWLFMGLTVFSGMLGSVLAVCKEGK